MTRSVISYRLRPEVKGGALIIPRGLLEKLQGRAAVSADDGVGAEARKRVELIAVEGVMAAERALGREPVDVSATKGLGHDLVSLTADGSLVFIEVKAEIKLVYISFLESVQRESSRF